MNCLISKDHLTNSDPFMMCNPLPLLRCLDTYRNRIGGTNNNNKRGKRSKTLQNGETRKKQIIDVGRGTTVPKKEEKCLELVPVSSSREDRRKMDR